METDKFLTLTYNHEDGGPYSYAVNCLVMNAEKHQTVEGLPLYRSSRSSVGIVWSQVKGYAGKDNRSSGLSASVGSDGIINLLNPSRNFTYHQV
jgi:hypothetical protein